MKIFNINNWLALLLLFLAACQSTTPFKSGENPSSYVLSVMQTLKEQASGEFSAPTIEEENLVASTINELMLQPDSRFYPLISLLKQNKVELMAQDAERLSRNPEYVADKVFLHQVDFYALVVRVYTRPTESLKKLKIKLDNSIPFLPANWESLSILLQKRLDVHNNQLVLLKKELLTAETQGNIAKQANLHEKIIEAEIAQGAKANERVIAFYLKRLITLTPDNRSPSRIGQLEMLASLYQKQGDISLARDANYQALAFAQSINDEPTVLRLQQQLGIVPENEVWVDYANIEHQRINDLNQAFSSLEGSNTAENVLALVDTYWRVGQINNATRQARNALSLARTENNRSAENSAITYLGDMAKLSGDLRLAQGQYTLAFGLLGKKNLSSRSAIANPQISKPTTSNEVAPNNQFYTLPLKIAMMAFFQGNNEFALKHLRRVREKAQTEQRLMFLARANAEIFIVNAKVGKHLNLQAEDFQNALMVLKNADDDEEQEEEVISEAAIVLAGLEQHSDAIVMFDRAINIAAKHERYYLQARYQTNKASSLHKMGETLTAIELLKETKYLLSTLMADMLPAVESLIVKFSQQASEDGN